MNNIDYRSAAAVAVNIRYACWKASQKHEQWPSLLATWLGRREEVGLATAILCDFQTPTSEQIESLAKALHIDEQDLVFTTMPTAEGVDLLSENLKRLLASTGNQTKGALAKEIGVSPATLSRWISGGQVPDTSARRRIAVFFGLRSPEELAESPIFLSYLPVSHGERLAWLNSRLQVIASHELHYLFPALLRIFSGSTADSAESSARASELRRLKRSAAKR